MSTVSLALMLPLSNFYHWRRKKEKRKAGTTGRRRKKGWSEPMLGREAGHLCGSSMLSAPLQPEQRSASGAGGSGGQRGTPQKRGGEEERAAVFEERLLR